VSILLINLLEHIMRVKPGSFLCGALDSIEPFSLLLGSSEYIKLDKCLQTNLNLVGYIHLCLEPLPSNSCHKMPRHQTSTIDQVASHMF
jgi:hypothetical protein